MTSKATHKELKQRVKEFEHEGRVRLNEQYRLLSLAIKQSSEGIAVSDLDGNMEYINDAFAKMHGYSPDEIIGKNLNVFHTPEQMPSVETANRLLKQSGEFNGEVWHVRRDGTLFPTLMHNSLIRDETNKPIGMMATLRDISDLKQAEEKLREREEKYRNLFETALVGLFRSRIESGRLLEANQAFADIFGYDSRDQLMAEFLSVERYANPERRKELLQQLLKRGRVDEFEILATRRDGSHIHVMLSANVYPEQEYIEGVLIDLSERKLAEEQIKASLREKDMLLQEIHHRVRNNFEIISSLLDMSDMQTSNQEIQSLWRDARTRINSMALIHSQLYQSGRFDRIDMGEHAQELTNHLSHLYAGSGKWITTVIEPSEVYLSINQAIPCTLALNELIANAFKHAFRSSEKGTIQISIHNSANNNVLLTIKDDGDGIPEGVDSNESKGLGLKLAGHLIASQLNGEMRITQNNGTEIQIEFERFE